jgi:hypothetical protein
MSIKCNNTVDMNTLHFLQQAEVPLQQCTGVQLPYHRLAIQVDRTEARHLQQHDEQNRATCT